MNPLDYFVWSEVMRRMAEGTPRAKESAAAYKNRLRRTAMGIPKKSIVAAVARMKAKAAEVVAADGGKIRSG